MSTPSKEPGFWRSVWTSDASFIVMTACLGSVYKLTCHNVLGDKWAVRVLAGDATICRVEDIASLEEAQAHAIRELREHLSNTLVSLNKRKDTK